MANRFKYRGIQLPASVVEALDRARHLIQSAPPVAWIVAASVVAAVVVGSQAMVSHHPPAHLETLFDSTKLSRRDVVQIESAFASEGLKGYKIKDGDVLVPAKDRALYVKAIDDNKALPAEVRPEPLDVGSIWDPPGAGARREKYARERQIARAVQSLRGIAEAHVLYDESEGGFPKQKLATAAANVWPERGQRLERFQAQAIIQMVSSAWQELQPEHVTVTDLSTGRTFHVSNSPGSHDLDAHRQADQYWTDKIRDQLKHIPRVQVAVTVELGGAEPPNQRQASSPPLDSYTSVAQPKHVFVSICVPKQYLQRLLVDQQESDPNVSLYQVEQRIAAEIRRSLAVILPSSMTAAQRQSSIVVTAFHELPHSSDTTKATTAQSPPYLGWSSISVVLLLGVALLTAVVWKWSRSSHSTGDGDSVSPAGPSDSVSEVPANTDSEDALKNELRDVIRRDPDAAAQKLSNWLEKAG